MQSCLHKFHDACLMECYTRYIEERINSSDIYPNTLAQVNFKCCKTTTQGQGEALFSRTSNIGVQGSNVVSLFFFLAPCLTPTSALPFSIPAALPDYGQPDRLRRQSSSVRSRNYTHHHPTTRPTHQHTQRHCRGSVTRTPTSRQHPLKVNFLAEPSVKTFDNETATLHVQELALDRLLSAEADHGAHPMQAKADMLAEAAFLDEQKRRAEEERRNKDMLPQNLRLY
jgi:hypothetical protein